MNLKLIPTIITALFLLIIISYYFLFLIQPKKSNKTKMFSSISIIVPAHNEEAHISEALESILKANFAGKKQIIVVDDGSKDDTLKIVKFYRDRGIIILTQKHSGKSSAINNALKIAKGEIIAIVDADSIIYENALIEMVKELGKDNVAAATGVIKVKNRKDWICMWVHIEQLYNSLMRSLLSRINANITTPGPLSMYRKNALLSIGGFSIDGFSEDQDIAIRLIRKGHKIGFSEYSIAETNMPYKTKAFFRQRFRFAKGAINILKKHLKLNTLIIDIYSLPLFLFSYIQSVIMGSFTLYQIINGYITYFASKGEYINWYVIKFFFEWLSIVGFIKWTYGLYTGITVVDFIAVVGVASTLLSYPLFIIAILKYDKKIDFWHVIPIFFMFPFWLLIMSVYIFCLPELFVKNQKNIWKKNE